MPSPQKVDSGVRALQHELQYAVRSISRLQRENQSLQERLRTSEQTVAWLEIEVEQGSRERELDKWREVAERERQAETFRQSLSDAKRQAEVAATAASSANEERISLEARCEVAESTSQRLRVAVLSAEATLHMVCHQRAEEFASQIDQISLLSDARGVPLDSDPSTLSPAPLTTASTDGSAPRAVCAISGVIAPTRKRQPHGTQSVRDITSPSGATAVSGFAFSIGAHVSMSAPVADAQADGVPNRSGSRGRYLQVAPQTLA